MKAKVTRVYFLRIELVVKLLFEVKSAVDISPHIYDHRFGLSSPIEQNLAQGPPCMVYLEWVSLKWVIKLFCFATMFNYTISSLSKVLAKQ